MVMTSPPFTIVRVLIDHYDTVRCHWLGGGVRGPFLWVGSKGETQSGEMGSAV